MAGVRIKDLPGGELLATEVGSPADISFGVEHIPNDNVREMTGEELQKVIGGGIRSLVMTGNMSLTGSNAEVVAISSSVAGRTLGVPANKTALIFNVGPESIAIVGSQGSPGTSLPGEAYMRLHSIANVHTIHGPIDSSGETNLTITKLATTNTVVSSTQDPGEPAAILTAVNVLEAGIMPSMQTAEAASGTSISGPPLSGVTLSSAATNNFNDFIWGYDNAGGTVKAFKYEYEYITSGHTLTTSDYGKPVVAPGVLNNPWTIFDHKSTTQFPTGILKRFDANRVVVSRPGDTVRIPRGMLQSIYNPSTDGRYLFWDRDITGVPFGRSWVSTRPGLSASHVGDLLEVTRVEAAYFEAIVRPFVAAPTAGTGAPPPSNPEILFGTANPSGVVNDYTLAVNKTSGQMFVPTTGGVWDPLPLPIDHSFDFTNDGSKTGSSAWDLSTGLSNRAVTLTGNWSVSPLTPPPKPTLINLKVTQNATGGWGITWPGTMTKQSAIVLNRAPNAVTHLQFYYDGALFHPQNTRKSGNQSLTSISGALTLNYDNIDYDMFFGEMVGNITSVTLTCSRTAELALLLRQDGVGTRTVTWPSAWDGPRPSIRTGPGVFTLVRLMVTNFSPLTVSFVGPVCQPMGMATGTAPTPSVAGINYLVTSGTYSNFLDGHPGQMLLLRTTGSTTLTASTGMTTINFPSNYTFTTAGGGLHAQLVREDTGWRQVW